ncbi:GH36-type glycosyl hydrolase domain-containing protein [Devosia beringensis]|uniref:GH36-type glycosyl hydrolase domain-containing protein n=1 Tax=Devosia beringensis TaxID=2657486 RepID=UPI00186B6BB2|nr:glucoamylase family protein [Devosia beringensis]
MDVLNKIDLLPGWLEGVKRFCTTPGPEQARAADWLLDNDYQVSRAIREVRGDMPADFYRRLHVMADGKAAQPRILAIAHEILATRSQVTMSVLVSFLDAFQQIVPLTTAELWALPSMLRLASLEMLACGFEALEPTLAPPLVYSRFVDDSRRQDPVNSIAQAITTIIAVQGIEWRDVVDTTSVTEALLHADPAGVYGRMDFETRDWYRNVVEILSSGSDTGELEIVQIALELARAAPDRQRSRHVGYWLIDDGREVLERKLGFSVRGQERLRRFALRHVGKTYALALVAFVGMALVWPVLHIVGTGAGLPAQIGGVLLSLLPATVLSISILHWLIARATRPRLLPVMDFRKGIPQDSLTCVAVPVIVSRADEIAGIMERLEIRYLSNPDPMLRFVLLSDYADAPAEHGPHDEDIDKAMIDAIRALNARYGGGDRDPFFLLHRARRFNPSEGCWMGWERKRGKLEQFNAFLLGGPIDNFAFHEGALHRLRGTRFVITLDADTTLPPGSAAKLVGTLAHPLNRAVIDPHTGKVVAGYAIVQPRVEILPLNVPVSLFCRLYAGDTAIDIYSWAVSDVYQDLFGTGTFVGKGIYDVAAFHQSLAGRIPENAVLSHDLFEGLYGRTALATNIVLYEDFPATYVEYGIRLNRWTRGDWQLLPWLGRKAPSADGQSVPNVLSSLDRWKIIDNLRRSLVAPALLLFFVGGWLLLPGSAWLWTAFAVLAPAAHLVGELQAAIFGSARLVFFGDLASRFGERFGRWFLTIAFLVSDTLLSLDAIFRTLWRLGTSGKHFLEWRSAAHASSLLQSCNTRRDTWRMMWPSTAVALLLWVDLALYRASSLLPAAPILLLWLLAPEIAVWLSKPRVLRQETLHDDDRRFLRHIARRTWLYFETFAGPEDNWLPPDNFQEAPKIKIAHRTSPTNIGLFLVSAKAAHDFGFVGSTDFVLRIRNAFTAIERLESYRGHILNWFDTRTLASLEPRYVSTVDSGNLAVSLVALRTGCLEAADAPAVDAAIWQGLKCTLDMLFEAVRSLSAAGQDAVDQCEAVIEDALTQATGRDANWHRSLDAISKSHLPALDRAVAACVSASSDASEKHLTEAHVWLERTHHHVRALVRETQSLLPWIALIADAPAGLETIAGDLFGTLSPALKMAALREYESRAVDILETAGLAQDWSAVQRGWLDRMRETIESGIGAQQALRSDLLDLATRCEETAHGMDFTFLYDAQARLFRIGYNVSTGQLDSNHYDLLATEARIASFFAIAKHDVPIEHWFSLGRPVTRLKNRPAVLSWNGSMFEYLMPPIFLPGQRDTLLGESEMAAVDFQRVYARERGVPWGISESAFAATDSDGNYQYRAFGVPGLGLRRGLTEDLVVAPYASALALCCWPGAAVRNMRDMQDLGAVGIYGFHDAIDYTPSRVAEGRAFNLVRNYMAHHHGMTMAAIANALDNDVFVRRALSGRRMQTVEQLLLERVPWDAPVEKGRLDEESLAARKERAVQALPSWVPSRQAMVPQMQMLGNGRMASWISESGAGGMMLRDTSLTRWRPDASSDGCGYWIYIRDAETGDLWTPGRLPTGVVSPDSTVIFHQHMAEFFQRTNGIAVRMEVCVSPADDSDIREISVTNESNRPRRIEFTSYAEVVLAPPLEDERHPAFSKLFVESDYLGPLQGLLFTRRPRRPEMKPPVLLHTLVADDPEITVTYHETDRARFIGRLGNQRRPAALAEGLSGTVGSTLDPIMSLQTMIALEPGETRRFAFVTVAGTSRGEVLEIAQRHALQGLEPIRRDAGRAAARQVDRLGIEPGRLPELQVLASLLQMPHANFRETPVGIGANNARQPDLWQFGISGDLPILLLRMAQEIPSQLLELLVKAQNLWLLGAMRCDLVVLRSEPAGYEAPLRERILAILRETGAYASLGTAGGIHLLSSAAMTPESLQRLTAAATVILNDDDASLSTKLDGVLERRAVPTQFMPSGATPYHEMPELSRPDGLQFDNGIGGFDPKNGDYLIHLGAGEKTPAPWCNVIANDGFGTIVSEAGLGFSWALNSGENRLTPWSNDPVSETPGEVLYLRDEQDGAVWTPTPAPLGAEQACQVRHGMGLTEWRRNSRGLEQTLRAFVPPDDPVKIVTLKLINRTDAARRITATYYAEWLLGAMASRAKPFTSCVYDAESHAILAENGWNPEFAGRVAFLTATLPAHSVTGSRYDFLGSEGNVVNPAALRHWDLGGSFAPGGDTCAAYQVHLDIEPGATKEVTFVLGQGASHAETLGLVRKWREPAQAVQALASVEASWKKRLSAVQVKTPDPAFDLMVNRWLLYQTIASRLMARAGFYQAGGAFGYRDQLQDVLAVLTSEPERARAQILLAAAHQFEDGDALHWWHPPSGRGVRTHCSDDFIWLAHVTARYVEATGDDSILADAVSFLKAEPLKAQEQDRYALFEAGATATLLEHCTRALNRMMSTGLHGLPLIGTGDWNDGMDRVGDEGRGESVWLAWFQIATIKRFAPLLEKHGDKRHAAALRAYAGSLAAAIETSAWDGRWYIRAFDDEGKPWGSHQNDECQIDSIAQSWAVIAGVAPRKRMRTAMSSARSRLVHPDRRLVQLLDPPFQQTPRDPGYIRAYPPGIRENGGQYTHSAAWFGHALAGLGDGNGAWQVFDIINPIRRTQSNSGARHYVREPYVLPGDVYGPGQNIGLGGWSWYTGAAGWTWQLGVEAILGLQLKKGRLAIAPCLPRDWGGFTATVRTESGSIEVVIEDPDRLGHGEMQLFVDGRPRKTLAPIAFPGSGKTRKVRVLLYSAATPVRKPTR